MPVFRYIWYAYFALLVAAFVVVNLYVSWLSTRITPLSTSIDLAKSGSEYVYDLPRLARSHYTLMLDLNVQGVREYDALRNWEQTKSTIISELNVELQLRVEDDTGWTPVRYEGSLDDWTLTTSGVTPGSTASLYKLRFEATPLRDYKLTVHIVEGNAAANELQPHFVLHGVDDGYFFLYRPYYNALVVIAAIAVAIFVRLVQGVFRPQMPSSRTDE